MQYFTLNIRNKVKHKNFKQVITGREEKMIVHVDKYIYVELYGYNRK